MPRSGPADAPTSGSLAIHRSRHLMAPVRLLRPNSFAEARRMLDDVPDAVPMAGGLDIVTAMKTGIGPSVIVWLGGIPGTGEPYMDGDMLVLPAACCHEQLARSVVAAGVFPDLVAAWSQLANVRIRHQGTIVGNVLAGVAGYEAAVLLAAAGARLAILAPGGGNHLIEVSEIATGPAGCPAPWLVTAVYVPARKGATPNRLLYDRSLRPVVSVAVGLDLQEGAIVEARAVVGGYEAGPILRDLPLNGAELDTLRRNARRVVDIALGPLPPTSASWRGEPGYPAAMARLLLSRLLENAL